MISNSGTVIAGSSITASISGSSSEGSGSSTVVFIGGYSMTGGSGVFIITVVVIVVVVVVVVTTVLLPSIKSEPEWITVFASNALFREVDQEFALTPLKTV
jgi:uncharacterized membrane protein